MLYGRAGKGHLADWMCNYLESRVFSFLFSPPFTMLGLFKVFNGSWASICLPSLYIPPMCSMKSGSDPAEWYVNSTWPGPPNQPPFVLKSKPPNNVSLCRRRDKKRREEQPSDQCLRPDPLFPSSLLPLSLLWCFRLFVRGTQVALTANFNQGRLSACVSHSYV